MKRDDLRVLDGSGSVIHAGDLRRHEAVRPVTDAEFEALAVLWARKNGWVHLSEPVPHNEAWAEWAKANGWVRLPVCADCGPDAEVPCPSCGGSGFARLVALDGIDVERMRRFHEDRDNDEMVRASEVHNLINPILAAIDQEDT